MSLMVVIMAAGLRVSHALGVAGNEADLARLEQGKILLEIIEKDQSGGAARVSALFHTNSQSIWNIIGYCKYELVYLKGLKLCEVLKPGLFETRIRHRTKSSWYTPTLDYTFDASRSESDQGKFHLVAGDLKVLQGSWSMQALAGDNEILVTHEVRVRPRFPTPKWLLRRSLRQELPDMLACIRGLAMASGDNQRIANDLQRCPGELPDLETGPGK